VNIFRSSDFSSLHSFVFSDIGDFLKEEIKGPAKFSCKTGSGCQFEEQAMNELITQVFGDPYITLSCFGGECVPGSLVPGYEVSKLHFVMFK
jgi:hypothetical protein